MTRRRVPTARMPPPLPRMHVRPRFLLQTGELDIPPEGDWRRSPSPEPIYDRNGIRQNTREMRYERARARRFGFCM